MRHVFPRSAVFSGERLSSVGGVAVDELAADFATPLYVLDRDELVGRMRAMHAAFDGWAHVAYAAKALCVMGVCQLAAAEGLALDVASAGELHTAARAGFPMHRVLLHGNNKSEVELSYAAELGVGRVVVDSFAELDRLEQLGAARGHTSEVLVRVTPGVEAHTHESVRTGHDDSKFGFALSHGAAREAVARVRGAGWLRLRGAHCHIGSEINAAAPFDAAARAMVGFLAEVRDAHGVALDELNLGGGLGIGYTRTDEPLSFQAYASTIRAAVETESSRRGLTPPSVTVEPGRCLVGPAGVTLYTVGTVKPIPGVRTYVSVDGGMSDNVRPALYTARYEFTAAGANPSEDEAHAAPLERPVTVVGKHCESGDVLGVDVELASAAPGQLLAAAATGAYSYAMASNYNRLPRPAMVLTGDGEASLLVRRETLDDLVAHDVALG
jgi:diaminopimelate decarboxylase